MRIRLTGQNSPKITDGRAVATIDRNATNHHLRRGKNHRAALRRRKGIENAYCLPYARVHTTIYDCAQCLVQPHVCDVLIVTCDCQNALAGTVSPGLLPCCRANPAFREIHLISRPIRRNEIISSDWRKVGKGVDLLCSLLMPAQERQCFGFRAKSLS